MHMGEVFSTMKVLIIGMVNLKVIPLIAWIGLKPGSAGGLKPEGGLLFIQESDRLEI